MYHSHLLINTGDNPDRVDWKRTRAWLRNLYRVHQRLCMAFPDKDKALAGKTETERYAEYCKPFAPFEVHKADPFRQADEDGSTPDVHQPRSPDTGFLFRIDFPVIGSVRRPVIVVQSANRPDWDFAFGLNHASGEKPSKVARTLGKPPRGNADFLLAAPPQVRRVEFEADDAALRLRAWAESRYEDVGAPVINENVAAGEVLNFILRANVVCTRTENGKKGRFRLRIDDETMKSGDRAAIEYARYVKHYEWLCRRLAGAATIVSPMPPAPSPKEKQNSSGCHQPRNPQDTRDIPPLLIETGWAHASRGKHDPANEGRPDEERKGMQWWAVTFRGRLKLTNPARFRELLTKGIGPGKAFGFGLLSVVPVKETADAHAS